MMAAEVSETLRMINNIYVRAYFTSEHILLHCISVSN